MSTGAQYVVAAYAVIWFVLLLYVIVAGARTARIAREVELLTRLVERRLPDADETGPRRESAPRRGGADASEGDERRLEAPPAAPGSREPTGLR